MLVRVGIENNNDGRSIAWALEHPGCFAYGQDASEAEANMQPAVRDYTEWFHRHKMAWMSVEDANIQVEEMFDAYYLNPDEALAMGEKEPYMVESFFRLDRQPLSGDEVERALKMLAWGRLDLLDVIKGLTPEQLDLRYAGERWSINGILRHIGGAEWWYMACVGSPFPEYEKDLTEDPLERLELVRSHFMAYLPKQVGVTQVIEHKGETWSPRKVLRRALWHERDHTQHIRKLLEADRHAGPDRTV